MFTQWQMCCSILRLQCYRLHLVAIEKTFKLVLWFCSLLSQLLFEQNLEATVAQKVKRNNYLNPKLTQTS